MDSLGLIDFGGRQSILLRAENKTVRAENKTKKPESNVSIRLWLGRFLRVPGTLRFC